MSRASTHTTATNLQTPEAERHELEERQVKLYAIYCSTPFYDNRDGYAGRRVERVSGYAYHRPELAQRLCPGPRWYDDEVEHFVAPAGDPWHPWHPSVSPEQWDDIPF